MTNKNLFPIVSASSNQSGISGAKKAWFHLGKIAKGTKEEDIMNYGKQTFPKIEFTVEKLENKGFNESFKLVVEFLHKDEVLDCARWPKM